MTTTGLGGVPRGPEFFSPGLRDSAVPVPKNEETAGTGRRWPLAAAAGLVVVGAAAGGAAALLRRR